MAVFTHLSVLERNQEGMRGIFSSILHFKVMLCTLNKFDLIKCTLFMIFHLFVQIQKLGAWMKDTVRLKNIFAPVLVLTSSNFFALLRFTNFFVFHFGLILITWMTIDHFLKIYFFTHFIHMNELICNYILLLVQLFWSNK